ncbi:MAG TPA: hypothetical protein ENI80_12125 [Acidiferrobacteraceae bacterium]|nr:hypothetical protein [Acidiferrobacteraceae bacterium]
MNVVKGSLFRVVWIYARYLGVSFLLLGSVSPAYAEPPQSNTVDKAVTKVEDLQSKASELVLKAASRLDSFFFSDRYQAWEDNKTNIRLRLNADSIGNNGTHASVEARFRIVLPGADGRFSLVGNDEDDDGLDSTSNDFTDESSVAIRYIGVQRENWGTTYDLGLRVRDSKVSTFLRGNVRRVYALGEHWAGRSENRFYWYTDTGFRNDARQYFERRLSKDLFFRSRSRLQWFEEEDGIFPEQRFTLYQRLDGKSALAYEALAEIIPASRTPFKQSNIINSSNRYNHAQLRLRYRRNVKWPWFFVEVWPTVALVEERDYELTKAIRLRFEVVFGNVPKNALKLDE